MTTPFSDFITFFSAVVRCALPFLLLYSICTAFRGEKEQKSRLTPLAAVAGAVAGALLAATTTANQYFTEYTMVLAALLPVTGLLCLLLSFMREGAGRRIAFLAGTLPFLTLLAAQSAVDLWIFISDEALSDTNVLNTGLIINGAALLLGAVAALWMIRLLSRFFTRIGAGLCRIFFVVISLLLTMQWVANVLISLIQLDEMTASRAIISYVARCHDGLILLNYLLLAGALAATGLFFMKRHRGFTTREADTIAEPERRKRRALQLGDRRLVKTALVVLAVVLASQGWYDAVVSRPPQLSPAQAVTADENGLVKIAIADVSDGHLHRYSFVTSDGFLVRFFIIQRYENSDKFGVVFDACQICGDDGYIESDNNIICIACNVSIFVPSIGRPGGCNPIPFTAETDKEFITITTEELEGGATYFSERVEITVQDPVSGVELSNLKAPFHYSFKGHEFSFESEKNMAAFVEDPEKYVKKKLKRRSMRIDGYKE